MKFLIRNCQFPQELMSSVLDELGTKIAVLSQINKTWLRGMCALTNIFFSYSFTIFFLISFGSVRKVYLSSVTHNYVQILQISNKIYPREAVCACARAPT